MVRDALKGLLTTDGVKDPTSLRRLVEPSRMGGGSAKHLKTQQNLIKIQLLFKVPDKF